MSGLLKRKYLSTLIICVIFCILNIIFPKQGGAFNISRIIFISTSCVCLLYVVFVSRERTLDEKTLLSLLFVISLAFRLCYVQTTPFFVRQHDVFGDNGHYDYIMTLFNGEELPAVGTLESWQYYQPPVWHFICASFLRLQTLFHIPHTVALENIQFISMLCSSFISLLALKLFRQLEIKGLPLCASFAVVAFHPTFILLSASVNNDVLSLMLSLLSLTLAIDWYKDPRFTKIIPLALSIGFAMGVKLSGGLISVGIAFLFAIVLFGKRHKKKLNIFLQFIVFGVICAPISLWWQVRNLIRFGIPMTYVPMLPENSTQYIGFHSIRERLFDFTSLFENGVYPARAVKSMEGVFDHYEYNIPLGALKSSVFGEYYIGLGNGFSEIFATILFYTGVVLAVFSIISFAYSIVFAAKREKSKLNLLISTAICSLVLLISYIKFCFEFPHFCTMDFRYIALTVVFGALYIGYLNDRIDKNNKMFGFIRIFTITLSAFFCISSIALYASIA
ncbi:MAG: glycosyltransferase family 39 protein [Clostridia bacterium]|nr:glycosyltransferase family 39 protein [Clostridia bacterium]